MAIRVYLAGATGWAGSALALAIAKAGSLVGLHPGLDRVLDL